MNEIVLLSWGIDWERLDIHFGQFFSDKGHHPGIPSRMMIGLHILKHTFSLSDEEVCARWFENPYFQYFCGETFEVTLAKLDNDILLSTQSNNGDDKVYVKTSA